MRFTRRTEAQAIWEDLLSRVPSPPEAYRDIEALVRALERLGIERPHRFYSLSSALTIIRNGVLNRENLRPSMFAAFDDSPDAQQREREKQKPVLLITAAIDDHNRGFEDGVLSQVIDAYADQYHVFYEEVANEGETQNLLNTVRGNALASNRHYVVHMGHGQRNLIELTTGRANETEFLDEADLDAGEISYAGFAGVTALACYTGLSWVRTAARNNPGVEFSGPSGLTRRSTCTYTPAGLPLISYEPGIRRIVARTPVPPPAPPSTPVQNPPSEYPALE